MSCTVGWPRRSSTPSAGEPRCRSRLGPLAVRLAEIPVAIGLVAIGSGLYLTTLLGPGPRDGLMTGLHTRTGRSLRLVRTLIEGSALIVGWLLGGTVGIGTVAFALASVPRSRPPSTRSEAATTAGSSHPGQAAVRASGGGRSP